MQFRSAFVLMMVAVMLISTAGIALAETELIFGSTQFTPIEEQQYIRNEILEPFTKATGIKVNMTCEDYGPFYDRLLAEAKSGKITTGVIGTLHGDFPALLADDILMELPPLTEFEGRTYIPEFVKLGQMGGKQVYVPWSQATYLMVANKKALEYLPAGADINSLTYDQLLEWAKNIYEKTGFAKLGFPAGPKGLFGRMLHGYLYPAFTGHQVQKFNSDEAVQMWDYLVELQKYVHPSSAIYESMADPLLLEEVWIAWDHTARIGPALREKPDDFVAFPSPAGPKGRAFITVISGLGIPKGTPNVEASLEFISYMTKPENQVKVLAGTGFFPTTLEASSYVPKGAQKILAEAVTKQAGSRDAIISLLPVGLGARTGEFVPIYRDAYQAIVLMGRPVKATLEQQGQKLEKLFKETGAPYPQP